MGVYYDLYVKTKKNKHKIQSLKYSLGVALFAFDEESFIHIPNKTYYVETTINKALNNLDDFGSKLIDISNLSHLDEWSEKICKNKIKEIRNMIERLEKFGDEDTLFCDMSEAVIWYNEEQLANFNPNGDLVENKKKMMDIASGKYNGLYTDNDILYEQDEYICSVIDEITANKVAKVSRIVSSSSADRTCGINMGSKRVFKCTKTFIFKREEGVKDYNEMEHYTLPVFAALQAKNIFLERTFEKTYERVEENEIAYKCNLYWEKKE